MDLDRLIIVVGLGHQGVSLVELFTEAGFEVRSFYLPYDAVRKEFFLIRNSKAHPPILYEDASSFEEKLVEIESESGKRLLVILTASEVVERLPHEGPSLWDRFEILASPCDAVRKLSDKVFVYDTLRQSGFPVANYCLMSDYHKGFSSSYPVIVKRNVERADIYQYKFQSFQTESALLSFIDTVPHHMRKYLMVQEAISPDAEDLDFRGYVHRGKVIAFAVVNEIRTFPAGVPSYLEEVDDPVVLRKVSTLIEGLLSEVGYSGFVGVDFKYDKAKGEAFLLDINARPPISVSSWLYKYTRNQRIQFARTLDHPEPMSSDRFIHWVNIPRDMRALVSTRFKGFNLWKVMTAKKDLMFTGDHQPFWLNLWYSFVRALK